MINLIHESSNIMKYDNKDNIKSFTLNNGSILSKLKYDKNNKESLELQSEILYNSFEDINYTEFDMQENIIRFLDLYTKENVDSELYVIAENVYNHLNIKYGLILNQNVYNLNDTLFYLLDKRHRVLNIFKKIIATYMYNLINKNMIIKSKADNDETELKLAFKYISLINSKFDNINKSKSLYNMIEEFKNENSNLKITNSLYNIILKSKMQESEKCIMLNLISDNSYYNLMNAIFEICNTSRNVVYLQILFTIFTLHSKAK